MKKCPDARLFCRKINRNAMLAVRAFWINLSQQRLSPPSKTILRQKFSERSSNKYNIIGYDIFLNAKVTGSSKLENIMKKKTVAFIQSLVLGLLFSVNFNVFAQKHPSLVLTKEGVQQIKANLGKVPLFDASLAETKAEVDAEIKLGIQIPIPKDFSGGYTHERHKKNYLMLEKAGALYQITGDEKYAVYVRDMLLAYAKLYPTLPLHPQTRSYARGKLFWQTLNDSDLAGFGKSSLRLRL